MTKTASFLRKTGLMKLANQLNNFRCKIIKKSAPLFNKEPMDIIYSDTFYKDMNKVYEDTKTPKYVAEFLIKNFRIESIVDLGCGSGIFLYEFEKKGFSVLGIDGSRNALNTAKISKNNLLVKDITKKINLNKKFDLVLCFEVAEHIPTKYSKNLVQNLTSLGNVVIFTAAPPGQGGTDHINEQPKEFWVNLFEKEGFYLDKDSSKKMSSYLKSKKTVWWIYENLIIFQKITNINK